MEESKRYEILYILIVFWMLAMENGMYTPWYKRKMAPNPFNVHNLLRFDVGFPIILFPGFVEELFRWLVSKSDDV